jgi:hypothetical protein
LFFAFCGTIFPKCEKYYKCSSQIVIK